MGYISKIIVRVMAVFPSFQNHLIMNFAVLMRLRYDVNERRQVVAAFSTGYMGFG